MPVDVTQLDETLLDNLEQAVVHAVNQAGALATEHFGGVLEVTQKSPEKGVDLVTNVDKDAQRIVVDIMNERFPEHSLLGEEDPPTEEPPVSDFLWAVDPIDGTKNYVNQSPAYAVCVAVMFRGLPIVGAIWTPWPITPTAGTGAVTVHARINGGAKLNGAPLTINETAARPHASRLVSLPAQFGARFKASTSLRQQMGEVRILGSTGYELSLVARGGLQYALSGPAHVWDFAAGILIVREAGGVTLTANTAGEFVDFPGWTEGYANDSATAVRLRKWVGPVIAASPATAKYLQQNLRMRRPSFMQKRLRRILSRRPRS